MTKYPKSVLAIAAALTYLPTLFFKWVYLDDYLIVQRASFYSDLNNIPAAFLRSIWDSQGQEYNFYRPVSTAVYILGGWLSKNISGEVLPWAFHLTNLLLLVVAVTLLFNLFRVLGSSEKTSMLATLILIVHPIGAGTVAWIGGQNELLLAIWVLCAFIAYAQFTESRYWWALHSGFLLMALLTKENAVVLPLLCAIYLTCSSRRGDLRIWLTSLLTWGLTLFAWFFMVRQGSGEGRPDFSRAFFAILEGVPFLLIYLGKFTLPLGFSTAPIPQDTGWYVWVAGGLTALTLFYLMFLGFKKKPLMLLGVAWFLAFLLPTFANLIPEQKTIFILRADRGYLATVGLVILLSQLDWGRFRSVKFNWISGLVAAVLLALNSIHQLDFFDRESFFLSAVHGSPHSPFAHTHLGDVYLDKKDYESAIASYQEAIRLNPRERKVHNNLGVAYLRLGRVDEAIEQFKKDIEITPTSLLAWPNLGYIYLSRGQYREAEIAYRRAVEINPALKDAWAGLVRVYTSLGDETKKQEALEMLRRAEIDMGSGL